MAKILFLDQSGKVGGAELCLASLVKSINSGSLVGLFADGPFRTLLEQQGTPVQVLLNHAIAVQKSSSLLQGLKSLSTLVPLILKVAAIARQYELIFANTQKALVVGAIASRLVQRPLVFHLHDILSSDHFSPSNRRLAVLLANQFATRVIANSKATQAAFVAAGGNPDLTQVIYNGFAPEDYQIERSEVQRMRQELDLGDRFVVGHFSRLSPWKGQHILLAALKQCPDDIVAIFVGDALFGEDEYVNFLKQRVDELGLQSRVKFLGFRSDVIPLMKACDLIAHTSTAPEPFGRVIVEAMLCERPVVVAAAGGVIELVEHERTGWLVTPGDGQQFAQVIQSVQRNPEWAGAIATSARLQASERFNLATINQQIKQLLNKALISDTSSGSDCSNRHPD